MTCNYLVFQLMEGGVEWKRKRSSGPFSHGTDRRRHSCRGDLEPRVQGTLRPDKEDAHIICPSGGCASWETKKGLGFHRDLFSFPFHAEGGT